MSDRPFSDKDRKPESDSLKITLGEAFAYYLTLQEISGSFEQSWNFSKSSGWMLKVSKAKKALYYLIPLDQSFNINLTIRENEREELIKHPQLDFALTRMKDAVKASEGFVIRFSVQDELSAAQCMTFIGALIKIRQ